MILSEENKKYIDSLSYFDLLERWRNAPVGWAYFMGETGDYWAARMKELRSKEGNAAHVQASKTIGWD